MAIDPRLADRYQAAVIDPRSVPLDLRWKGILGANKQLAMEQVPDLVRLAASRPTPGPENRARFQSSFKDADQAFLLQGNDRELSLLAAETISHAMTSPSRLADVIALFIRASQYSGWGFTVPEIVSESEQYLAQRSVAIRRIDRPAAIVDAKMGTWKKTLDGMSAEATQASQQPLAAWFTKLGTVPVAETGQVNSQLAVLADLIIRATSIQGEELNILWWLFGESSDYFGTLWSDVPTAAVSLVAATELADLCTILPAPMAAEAFLGRAIRSAGLGGGTTLTVADAMAHTPNRWQESVLPLTEFGDLTPLITGAKRFDSADESWIGRAERASGITLRDERTHLAIGWQMLTELQIVRMAEETKRG